MAFISHTSGQEPTIPKRFSLLPSADGFQVNVSAQCVGYVQASDNSWLARDEAGAPISMTENVTMLDAVTAVFKSYDVGQGFTPIR